MVEMQELEEEVHQEIEAEVAIMLAPQEDIHLEMEKIVYKQEIMEWDLLEDIGILVLVEDTIVKVL